MLSRRTAWPRTLNRLTGIERELRQRGEPLLDLTCSNPTHADLPLPDGAIRDALATAEDLRYAPDPRGILPARRAISRYYAEHGIEVEEQRIFVTASTSEAYAVLFKLLADPGDRVLIPAPSYPLFEHLASLEGISTDSYPLHYADRWWIDHHAMRQRVTDETRAILVVSPNNPTGSVISQDDHRRLDRLAAARSLALVVDEVFSDYVPVGAPDLIPTTVGREGTALSFSLSGISKVLALPQMKLAWMVIQGPSHLVDESASRLELVQDTYLSVATPIQLALPRLMELREEIQTCVKERLSEASELLDRALETTPALRRLRADGGWYAVLRLPPNRSEEDWVVDFLQEDRVLTHPGWFYNFDTEPYVVLSLLTPPSALEEGLKRIARRIDRHAPSGEPQGPSREPAT